MSRYLRVPVGERGTAADNRSAIAALKLVPDWDEAMRLPDGASVLVPADELRYPHLVRDDSAYRVCVLADMPSQRNIALTVLSTPDRYDALQLLEALHAYLADPTVEVAEAGRYGVLRTTRMERRTVIMPDEQPEPAEVSADG